MNAIFTIEFSNHLVASLLHTLWQGALIASLLWIVLRTLPARQATARYTVCVIALTSIVFSLSATWALTNRTKVVSDTIFSGSKKMVSDTISESVALPSSDVPFAARTLHEIAKPKAKKTEALGWMRLAAMIWGAGVLVMLVRALRAMLGAGRLRRRCVAIDEPSVLLLLDVVRSSMRIARRVKLAACERISSPAVIGIVWPTILLPMSVVTGTNASTLRMILAHELAHVRRHDYLVNLFQLLIEAVLFFNPAVWWISRQIRIEREACCDARAIASGAAPSDYVKAIATFAQGLAKPQAALMAMSGNQQPGGLLDRVRRALLPSHRPGLRLPWYSLTGALIVGALVLGSVWRTSALAVELAEKLLTPQERIEKAREAQKEYSQTVAYGGKIKITGKVKTADGKKIPRNSFVQISVKNQNSSMSTSRDVDANGEFKLDDINAGSVTATVSSPGYVPAFAGPIAPDESGKLEPLNLVLERGFIATFHVTDDAGQPINAAAIVGAYKKDDNSCYAINLTTDASGTATTDSGADLPVDVTVDADGFEPGNFDNAKLTRSEPLELRLKRAKPTSGVVLDKETGKPIAGAKIRIAAVMGPKPKIDLSENGKPDATTDAEGKFNLNKLRGDSTYVLWVTAAKHGHELVHDVAAGKTDLEIKLGPGIIYKGKITGALDKLYKGKGNERHITYSIQRNLNNNGWGSSANAPVTIKDGVGTFEIEDLWPGNMNISTGARSFSFNVVESRDDIVLDLSKEPEKPKQLPKRKVIITFNTPEGAPPPTGTIGITADKSLPGNGLVNIKDGKAEFEIETPAQIGYKPTGTVGYWFKEEWSKEVPEGDEPMEFKLDVIPAGAIFGKVTGAVAGKDLPGKCLLSIITDKSAGENVHPDTQERVQADGKFFIGGIPLGGTYRILSHIDKQFAISDPIELDESQPLREIELKFEDGVAVECEVVGPDDQPVQGVAMEFSVNVSGHGFGWGESDTPRTDPKGKVKFEHVVPDIADYAVGILPKKDFQTQHAVIHFDQLPLRIKLEKGLVLEGVVKDQATGNPVRGMVVKAWSSGNAGRAESESATNEKGEFRFSNLAPGKWNFQCDDYNRISQSVPLNVDVSDQNDAVDLFVKLRESK
jgi:beta-lactamase regulating signal transducer with metallopeptidase domain